MYYFINRSITTFLYLSDHHPLGEMWKLAQSVKINHLSKDLCSSMNYSGKYKKENLKIQYGRKHFEALDVDYQVIENSND